MHSPKTLSSKQPMPLRRRWPQSLNVQAELHWLGMLKLPATLPGDSIVRTDSGFFLGVTGFDPKASNPTLQALRGEVISADLGPLLLCCPRFNWAALVLSTNAAFFTRAATAPATLSLHSCSTCGLVVEHIPSACAFATPGSAPLCP